MKKRLAKHAEAYAKRRGIDCYWSLGENPTLLFPTPAQGITPNIIPEASLEIRRRDPWLVRLNKPHSPKRALPEERRQDALQLESSNSSDALLMNVFCVQDLPKSLLNILPGEVDGEPVFGFNPKLSLHSGKDDTTELDMLWGDMVFEAKLTESEFKAEELNKVLQYTGVKDVVDLPSLTFDNHKVCGYQLIRNVLAARAMGKYFVVIIDQHRPDLLRQWWNVHSAILDGALRRRCSFLTWQELGQCLRSAHREVLVEKYGI